MKPGLSPKQRRQSRKKLLETHRTAWCDVATRKVFPSTLRNINTLHNVTRVPAKHGWKDWREVYLWLRNQGFSVNPTTQEDCAAEWLYDEEQQAGLRQSDLSEIDNPAPKFPDGTTLTMIKKTCWPVLPEPVEPEPYVSSTTPPPERDQSVTKLAGQIWQVIEIWLSEQRNKPTKCYDAWLSDCALYLMEMPDDKIILLGQFMKERRRLPQPIQKRFDRFAMKRRISSWDPGQAVGHAAEMRQRQRNMTEEYWDKLPVSGLESDRKDPDQNRRDFIEVMIKLAMDVGQQHDYLSRVVYSICTWPNMTNDERAKQVKMKRSTYYKWLSTMYTRVICSCLIKTWADQQKAESK